MRELFSYQIYFVRQTRLVSINSFLIYVVTNRDIFVNTSFLLLSLEPDDSFVTPPSTPPSEEESSSEPPSVVNLTGELSNESLMASMYDR